MLPILKHNLTNWVDGMKINRSHFVDSENALLDLIRDHAGINNKQFSYGLLIPVQGEKSSLDCNVQNNQTGGLVKFSVRLCRGITLGGHRIEIIPGIHEPVTCEELEIDRSFQEHLAIITVDHINRMPHGMGIEDEYPPRNPHTVSSYKVSVVPLETLDSGQLGMNHLAIAKFVYRGGELIKDNNYVPPCTTLLAHPGARTIGNQIGEYFSSIQNSSIEVIQKAANQATQTDLSHNVERLCRDVLSLISANSFSFKTIYTQMPPVFIAEMGYKIVSLISVHVNCLSDAQKDDILNYFSHWSDLTPGKFQDLIAGVSNSDFDHEDIQPFFTQLMEFFGVWLKLLDDIKNTKMIGEKRGGSIIGGNRLGHNSANANPGNFNAPPAAPSKKRSFFD